MSVISELFMKEIHQIITESADGAMLCVGPMSDLRSPSIMSDQARKTLHEIVLNDEEEKAFRVLLTEVGRSVAFGIFSTVDGVADREGLELPDLALVVRETGRDLSDGFLHDEFYEQAPD
jgi:hypothetical protein